MHSLRKTISFEFMEICLFEIHLPQLAVSGFIVTFSGTSPVEADIFLHTFCYLRHCEIVYELGGLLFYIGPVAGLVHGNEKLAVLYPGRKILIS